MKRLALLVPLACATPALADEGMWTFDNFPSAQVKQTYGFEPTQPWLDKVRLGTVQIDDDASGSFVSPDGLVMPRGSRRPRGGSRARRTRTR